MSESSTTTSPEFVSVECEKMKVNLANAGEFITVANAAISLEKYLGDPQTPARNESSHIFGHVFGINSLKKVLMDIDIFNARQGEKDPKIAAIKCYYGISKRNDCDFPLKPADGEFRDLILMPVLDTGVDFHKILGIDDDEVLSGSRPCPNQCGEDSFLSK
ncbi:hypothetical protein OC25_03790 [Pedobacter kyungheensis]|uniref:Uncharacterized protein n=2 Tax=Pedobacter TaxID=84567 RepID=A0A1G6K456_9SPHI|nr:MULTISPECIES: hypothetical protein [Pedobacter]KIA96212.1 hypothetical protein OC25_03790 [Pedobacter kyungheensis]SDC25096.1 hypothetical protein SAMN04488024_101632 [Pedobacter soli]